MAGTHRTQHSLSHFQHTTWCGSCPTCATNLRFEMCIQGPFTIGYMCRPHERGAISPKLSVTIPRNSTWIRTHRNRRWLREDPNTSAPIDMYRPSARKVSNHLLHQNEDTKAESGVNMLWVTMGQFIDHDIAATPVYGENSPLVSEYNIKVHPRECSREYRLWKLSNTPNIASPRLSWLRNLNWGWLRELLAQESKRMGFRIRYRRVQKYSPALWHSRVSVSTWIQLTSHKPLLNF